MIYRIIYRMINNKVRNFSKDGKIIIPKHNINKRLYVKAYWLYAITFTIMQWVSKNIPLLKQKAHSIMCRMNGHCGYSMPSCEYMGNTKYKEGGSFYKCSMCDSTVLIMSTTKRFAFSLCDNCVKHIKCNTHNNHKKHTLINDNIIYCYWFSNNKETDK